MFLYTLRVIWEIFREIENFETGPRNLQCNANFNTVIVQTFNSVLISGAFTKCLLKSDEFEQVYHWSKT